MRHGYQPKPGPRPTPPTTGSGVRPAQAAGPSAANNLRFIGWKILKLLIYVLGYPFLFVGAWATDASHRCHERANRRRRDSR